MKGSTEDSKASTYLALLVGLAAVSTAAVLVRRAQAAGAPSLVIAAGRLLVAAAILTPAALARHRGALRRLGRRDLALGLLSGAFLALHFGAWISSLEYTSIIASAVIVNTSPLFVAALSWIFLRERVGRPFIAGLLLAIAGGALVAWSGDAGISPRPDPALGNTLALTGSLSVAAYFVIGRSLRARLHVVPYVWLVYGTAAVILTAVVFLGGGGFTGCSAAAYLYVLAIGLVPQLIGHSSLNYALGHLPAPYVVFVALLEPVGSTALGIIIQKEWPAALTTAGAAVILLGALIASRDRG